MRVAGRCARILNFYRVFRQKSAEKRLEPFASGPFGNRFAEGARPMRVHERESS